MKIIKKSSPFLFGLFFGIFLFPSRGISQEVNDSTYYYHKIIFSPKKGDSLKYAIPFYEKKISFYKDLNDTISIAKFKEYIANAQLLSGLPFESEQSAIEALSLLDNIPEDSVIRNSKKRISNHLGRLYRKISALENAIKYFNKAFYLNRDSIDSIAIINNIATIYMDQKEYGQAIELLNTIDDKLLPLGINAEKATALDNLGFSQSKLNFPQSLSNMEIALQARLKIGDYRNLFSSYRHLSYYYLDRNDRTTAKTYVKKVDSIADIIEDPKFKLEAISLKILLNNNIEAQIYKRISDSLQLAKQKQENKYIATKYDYAKIETLAKENELKAAKAKTRNYLYLFIVLLIVCIATGLFIILRFKHKREKVQQVIETESRISKKVHDELANGIHTIMTRLQRDLPKEIQEKLIDDLDIIYKKTRNISHDISAVSGGEKYHIEIKDMLGVYQKEDRVIMIKGLTPALWVGVAKHKKITLYHVLREMMVNMDKHSQAKIVIVAFKKKYKKIIIDYMDNGVGFSKNHLSKGIGLQNTENRIKTIGGTCTFNSTKGKSARITISFPE